MANVYAADMQALKKQAEAAEAALKKLSEQVASIKQGGGSQGTPKGNLIVKFSSAAGQLEIKAAIVAAENAGVSMKLVDKAANVLPEVLKKGCPAVRGSGGVVRLLFRLAGLEPSCSFAQSNLDGAMQLAAATTDGRGSVTELDKRLASQTTLTGHQVTSADYLAWGMLSANPIWSNMSVEAVHANRWFTFMEHQEFCEVARNFKNRPGAGGKAKSKVASAIETRGNGKVPAAGKAKKGQGKAKGAKGKKKPKVKQAMVWKLPKGVSKKEWKGKMVTRFPPEPSGYLHIGHVKAIFLNYELANQCKGKMLLRFDDTNPAKEKAEFETSIKQDIKKLGVEFASSSYTSDWFPQLLEIATDLVKKGEAFIEKNPGEMSKQRFAFAPSPFRDASVADNLAGWEEMQKGSATGKTMVLRIKLDYKSPNGTLRDPVIYRCKPEPHHRSGTKYKVYPTYDFACPIVDSVEGVTHACRTKEYNDREDQYKWIWKLACRGRTLAGVKLKPVKIITFSRLVFVRTELSKRKLGYMVDKGHVGGWNDPRMPTVQGILRRGLQVESLREFAAAQALSQSESAHHWDKIWNLNKKKLDPKVGRFFAVAANNTVPVIVSGAPAMGCITVPLHPKHTGPNDPKKAIHTTQRALIEAFDAKDIKVGQTIALMRWTLVDVTKVVTKGGTVVQVEGKINPTKEGWGNKAIPKLTWVADAGKDLVKIQSVELDFMFNEESAWKAGSDFKDNINPDSWQETNFLGEPALRLLKRGDCLQLERRGFYVVDEPSVGPGRPMRMFFVPDGRNQAMSALQKGTGKVKASTG